MWRGRAAVAMAGWPLIAASLLTVGIGAPVMFGVAYITDRMPLFAVLCLLSVLSIRPARWTCASRAAGGILVATVIVRLIAVAASFHAYDRGYREFRVARRDDPARLADGGGRGAEASCMRPKCRAARCMRRC